MTKSLGLFLAQYPQYTACIQSSGLTLTTQIPSGLGRDEAIAPKTHNPSEPEIKFFPPSSQSHAVVYLNGDRAMPTTVRRGFWASNAQGKGTTDGISPTSSYEECVKFAKSIATGSRPPRIEDVEALVEAAKRFEKEGLDISVFGSALYVLSHQPSLDANISSPAQRGLMIVAEMQMKAIKARANFDGMSDEDLLVWVDQVVAVNHMDEMTAIFMEVMKRRTPRLINSLLTHVSMEVRFYMIYHLLFEGAHPALISSLWEGQKNDMAKAVKEEPRARDVLSILYLFAQCGVQEARSFITELKRRGWFVADMERLEAIFFRKK